MNEKLKKFFNKPPEIVIHWQDDCSPAEGWLIINSLRGGAAGGGTRMHANCSKKEMIDLAKSMELKFTISGPQIGGAKSGIRYDFKSEEDKINVLRRWLHYIKKELESRYGTGGDQNISMGKHMAPLLKEMGIKHSQQGIVNGMYPNLPEKQKNKIINNLTKGVFLPIKNDKFLKKIKFDIADMITGYGVISAIKQFYKLIGTEIKDKKIIIEGFGVIGKGAAYYAVKKGMKVVGIIDKDWYIYNNKGLDILELLEQAVKGILHTNKNIKKYTEFLNNYPEADIFIPAATSYTIDKERMEVLKKVGVSLIVPGANTPFLNSEVEKESDKKFSIIPDFISNCGMARCFAYLMELGSKVNEPAIFKDVDMCISEVMSELMDSTTSLYNLREIGFDIALNRLEEKL